MKKILLGVMLVFGLVMLGGCNEKSVLVDVKAEDLFTMEGNYFIFFYKDDCSDCEQTKPIVINYINLIENDPEFVNKRRIYGCNLSDPDNAKLFRAYDAARLNWGEGQGDSGTFWVNGVTNYNDLYISETASLISIGSNSNDERIANFQAAGYEAIYSRLYSHLGLE